MLERTPLAAPVDVWLKVNSGMNRAGFVGDAVAQTWQRLQASGKVGRIVLMTHFARADEPELRTTLEQLQRFEAATASLPGAQRGQLGSDPGLVAGAPRLGAPGILLYGADPMPAEGNGLRAVMTLESAVMAVARSRPARRSATGAAVAERPTRVGLVAMGYADGYRAGGARRHPGGGGGPREPDHRPGVDGHADDRPHRRRGRPGQPRSSYGASRCRSTTSPRPRAMISYELPAT